MTKEHQNREWKESWRDEHLKAICGFANAEGGKITIGKDDKGQVVGIKNAKELLEVLPNKIRDLLGIMVDINLHKSAGKEYLEISVPAYQNPISYKGEHYYRSGSTNQALKGVALDRFLLRKQGKHWDSVPVPYLKTKELSKEAIATFRRLAKQSGRLSPSILKESLTGLLDKLHLFDGKRLKRAAALLFHPDPERFFTGAYVKIGFFRTNAELLYHDEIHGDLFSQNEKTIDLLATKYLKAGISYRRTLRVETLPVPEDALREAILNALIHKDYSSGSPIQISVYDDKLMIWNSGELPPHWTVGKLKKKHSSHPFNPDIANAFFRAGQIETWGHGIEKIFAACKVSGTPIPKFDYEPTGLWVEFPFSKTATQSMATSTVKTPVETQVKTPVKILQLLQEHPEMTLAEVAEIIGKSISAVERASAKLVKEGRLKHVGPQKGGRWEIIKS